MQKNDTVTRIYQSGIMAIVRSTDNDRVGDIAEACLQGGIDVVEMSYTLPTAGSMIRVLSAKYHTKVLIGAGTVLDSQTARIAILNGAKFIISPIFNKEVALICNLYQIPYCPGCSSMTEMVTALEYGASFIKIFPNAEFFGPKYLKTIKVPIPNMPILSSGGVSRENAKEWFENGASCLGVGSLLTIGGPDHIYNNAKFLRGVVDRFRKS
jgi:2-dehydro-3-deoxyphosphogluconate aldolase/(4S)-4-hydroxy-2-oxoglutarate aldolase